MTVYHVYLHLYLCNIQCIVMYVHIHVHRKCEDHFKVAGLKKSGQYKQTLRPDSVSPLILSCLCAPSGALENKSLQAIKVVGL